MNKKYIKYIKYLSLIFIISISFGITSFANELIYETKQITSTDNEALTEQGIFNDGWRLGTYSESAGYSPGRLPNNELFEKNLDTGWYQSPERLTVPGEKGRTPMYIGFHFSSTGHLMFGNNLDGKDDTQYKNYLKAEDNVAVLAKEGIPVVPDTVLELSFDYFNVQINGTITSNNLILAFFKDENGEQIGDKSAYINPFINSAGEQRRHERKIRVPKDAVSMSLQFYPLDRSLPWRSSQIVVSNLTIYGEKVANEKSAPVKVIHKDEKTGRILKTEEFTGSIGSFYTTSPSDFTGYQWNEIAPENSMGIFTKLPQTVIYEYEPKSEGKPVYIKFLDKLSQDEIAEDEVIEGPIGSVYKAQPKEIEGYELTSPFPENEEGRISDDVQTVTYYYDKINKVQWLPSYSKWKNSNTATIPKENAFVMMYSDKTKVEEYSDGIKMDEALQKDGDNVQFDPTKGTQWIRWSNVGYYKGQNIGVKLSVTPDKDKPGPVSEWNFIGFRNSDFLDVAADKEMGHLDVKYEFLDEKGQPIEISGYWTMGGLNDSKLIKLKTSQFDYLFSTPATGDNPILISYELNGDIIEMTGHGHDATDEVPAKPENLIPSQLEVTATYTDQTSFSYVMSSTPNNPFKNSLLSYNSSSIAKVGISDPQPIDQTVKSVTKDNRDKLTNEFVQQIPYESSGNRNQNMTWTVSNIENDDVFKTGVWQVYDETGKEQTDLFEFDKVNQTIKPKDLKNSNLYNHYYRFVYSLPFDESKEIQENQLVEQNNGKYLNYSQDISLTVDKLSPVVATPTTDINFMATINYSYTDEEGKPITMDGLAKTGTGLITQPYPVNEAPDIQGYTFNRSEPSDLMNKKILYTDNPVNFIYDKINKVQMTVNYYQLDRQGKETTHRVIDDLQTGNTVEALVEEVEVGKKISEFIPQPDFNSYLYKSSIVTNDVTNESIEDDIVPMNDFTVNRYYQPLENLSVPKTISFGEKNAQRLKDEYSVKNDPSPIGLTSGYSDVNWSLHASSDGLFSEGTKTRLLSDMYFRLNDEKMIINEEDTVLASQVNEHYYDLPLVTEDNKEGLFLKIGNSGTKDSKYSGKIKFSMVTGP
ncbi:MucBP domain-containing protein [Vagococcus jeotgali]|uniref:MucBP domain-containing protein n=1 Tax=Vagococcus jeotgali TaxID=3109030 RepID=UPI002DDB3B68|nr:MucBP domain-containing protein [Vagococcus sp. B2T-5]